MYVLLPLGLDYNYTQNHDDHALLSLAIMIECEWHARYFFKSGSFRGTHHFKGIPTKQYYCTVWIVLFDNVYTTEGKIN